MSVTDSVFACARNTLVMYNDAIAERVKASGVTLKPLLNIIAQYAFATSDEHQDIVLKSGTIVLYPGNYTDHKNRYCLEWCIARNRFELLTKDGSYTIHIIMMTDEFVREMFRYIIDDREPGLLTSMLGQFIAAYVELAHKLLK